MVVRGMRPLCTALFGFFALVLVGCATPPVGPGWSPQAQFFDRVRSICGQSFAGRVVTSDPLDAGFAVANLRVEGVSCTANQIRLRFHVGEDHSRTWVLTRYAAGLELKHDHRHADGSPDVMTNYGGLAPVGTGSARRQAFPADAESQRLFLANDRSASVDNVWAMEINPGRMFAYELRRSGRHFRVEFDLRRPTP
jgi:hypothetical protein